MSLPLCVRIDHDDARSAAALQATGWRWIEVLLTYECPSRHWLSPAAEKPVASEHEAIVNMVERSFTHDRLHADPEVSKEDADRAKRHWARDALEQRECFVKRIDGRPVAFCSLIVNGAKHRVDLICVDEHYRGRGIAKRLLTDVMSRYSPCGLVAGTQAKNEAARLLYEGLGMGVVRRQSTWHKTP